MDQDNGENGEMVMKLMGKEQLKRRIYYSSPESMRNIFWNVYLKYIKIRFSFINILKFETNFVDEPFDRLVYVDPKQIKYCLTNVPVGDKFRNKGVVEDGNWDIERRIPFENNGCFIALNEHFVKSVPLEKTKFYGDILKSIEGGGIYWGCETKAELENRFKKISELYYTIKNDGYKTQRELGNQLYLDEVTVNIGRNGEILFEDGEHRLSIAKILGLKEISVVITKRHYQWVKFKNEIHSYSMRNSGKVYQPLTHPDLRDFPSMHTDYRWRIISENLPLSSGSVLDIGANWGYFCHKFEDLGFECYAVENNPTELYFLNKLKAANGKKFTIISKPIFDVEKKNYDIILALNIFHHFLQTKEAHENLTHFLNEISAKVMFFEPHNYHETQMEGSYSNYDDIDFVNYIITNSCFTNCKCIGGENEGRNIYMLTL